MHGFLFMEKNLHMYHLISFVPKLYIIILSYDRDICQVLFNRDFLNLLLPQYVCFLSFLFFFLSFIYFLFFWCILSYLSVSNL